MFMLINNVLFHNIVQKFLCKLKIIFIKIKHSDIDIFGSFMGYQMRKNGRDEKNL